MDYKNYKMERGGYQKYRLAALTILMILLGCCGLILAKSAEKKKELSPVVDVISEQRLLLEKISYQALISFKEENPEKRQANLSKLESYVREMRFNHHLLLTRTKAVAHPNLSRQIGIVLEATPYTLNNNLSNYWDGVEALILSKEVEPEKLEKIIGHGYSAELMNAMEIIIELIDADATGNADNVRRVSTVMLMAIPLILLWEISSWFQPDEEIRTTKEEDLQSENEKLQKRISELEDMSAMMAHDFKKPLRTIGSFAQLAKKRLPAHAAEDIKEYLEYIEGSVSSLAGLADAIMDYSKLNGREPIKEDVILDNLLDEVKLDMHDDIKEKNVDIYTFNLPIVKGNRLQLMRVFRNLLENGIKYNESETPKLIIENKETETHHCISIKDNGIGIAEEYKEQVFDIFQRLNAYAYPGNGIGLASCKKIIGQHQGEIWLESEIGKGTAFYFTLPKAVEIIKEDVRDTPWLKAG